MDTIFMNSGNSETWNSLLLNLTNKIALLSLSIYYMCKNSKES